MKTKIVCYCNTHSVFTSNILLDKLFGISIEDIEIVSIIETGNSNIKYSRFKRLVSLVKNLKKINFYIISVLSVSIEKIAQKNRVHYHIPADLNINSKKHLEYIDSIQNIDSNLVALVFGCPQLFKNELLSRFKYVINYHDSYLPAFRGLNATAWSRYEHKDLSGYTFHIVDETIDTGQVIYQELLSYNKNWNIHQHLYNKTKYAGQNMNKLINYILFQELVELKKMSYFSKYTYYSNKMKDNYISDINSGVNSLKINKTNFEKAFSISL